MARFFKVIPEDIRAFGHHAALIVGQIEYWTTQAKTMTRQVVRREGFVWYARPKAQMLEDFGLTHKQCRNALTKLYAAGVLLRQTHLVDSKTVPHYRLDLERLGQVRGCPPGHDHGCAPEGTTGQALEGTTYKSPSETESKVGEKETSVVTDAALASPGSGEGSEMNVKDVLAGSKRTSHVPVTPSDASKPGQLESVLKSAWCEAYPETYLRPLTAKQMGQLGQFAKKCPRGVAGQVLDWTVRHWSVFASLAVAHEGAFNVPKQPAIDFLLRYSQSAVNGWQETATGGKGVPPAPSKWVPPKNVPGALQKNVPVSEPDEDDKPATLEEVAKILGLD